MRKKKKNIDYIVFLLWAYMIIIIPSFLLISFFHALAPEWELFNQLSEQTFDITTLIVMALLFPGLGTFLLILNRRVKPLFFWKMNPNHILADLTISFSLAFILWRFFSVLRSWQYLGLLVLIAFFVLYLPQIFLFFNTITLNDFKTVFPVNHKANFFTYLQKNIKGIIVALFFVFFVNQLVIFSNKIIVDYKKQQGFLSRHPYIKKGEPYLIYRSSRIILLGKNFGWRTGNITTAAYNQYGKIDITLWTDTKIIFQTPLHWKTGEIIVWIEKPTNWEDKDLMLKSNQVKFKLLDTTGPWDADDNAYFQQLKHLDKETLMINGYITPTVQPRQKR